MGPLLLCCLFYIIGSFPTGHLVGKLHGITIADHGSGNVGATNLSRVLGKKAGLQTLAGDLLKGLLPLLIVEMFGYSLANLGCLGLFLVLGHCFSLPPYLKGGKGVATSLGVFLGLSPLLALLAVVTFGIVMAAWRIVSLASVTTALVIPIYAMLFYPVYYQPVVPWLMAISAVVVYRHRDNLQRLILGQEKRFEFKRMAKPLNETVEAPDNSRPENTAKAAD